MILKKALRLLFFLSPLHLVDMLLYNVDNCVDAIIINKMPDFCLIDARFSLKKVDYYSKVIFSVVVYFVHA